MCKKRTINEKKKSVAGFTLIEMMLSIVIMGFVLIAISGVFMLFQKSAATTSEYADAQQNARIAIDYMTGDLRQAGSQTDYSRGQRAIVHAGPYQVIFNADIDDGQVIDGMTPLTTLDRSVSSHIVPLSGSTIYSPSSDFVSDAETVVFTLDSSGDGVINDSDRGDDSEETGLNTNLFVLKKAVYGFNGAGANEMREYDLAILRGPNLAPTWMIPEPLFQYYYNHDDDVGTPDRLWGDTDNDGQLDSGEILAITPLPDNFLSAIQRVKITVMSESNTYDRKYETNGGFLNVTMNSEVYVRNMSRMSSMVTGKVFHDADGDGVIDSGESGIPDVTIRLAGQRMDVITDNFGSFFFALPAGEYSVQEVDPSGFTSTTANLVSLSLVAGQTTVVNFGDISDLPSGVIYGMVFEDDDKNGIIDGGEAGIEGALISLDSGEQIYSDENGYYAFTVPQGNYTVVETDPSGYSSTTPNSDVANIFAAGDTVTINFGDFAGATTGTLEGYVYVDENEDGIRGAGEEGLPNVTLTVSSGDSTMTNTAGYYSFNLEPDLYWIEERDHYGYTSTTVNKFTDIPISADTVIVRDFGDVLEIKQDFVEIHISNTERVLSVSTSDLHEDEKHDTDIVLGTALAAGFGNMLVFHNKCETSATPVTELFDSDPSYWRDAGNNVNVMFDNDFNDDGVYDIFTGLDINTQPNLQLWFTQAGGILPVSPDKEYMASGLNEVMDCSLADLDVDGEMDLVAALRDPAGTTGGFETFIGGGDGDFSSREYITRAGPLDIFALGGVWAVETGDVDGDGDQDIVVGSHFTTTTGYIDIYLNTGYASANFVWDARYVSDGAVNDLEVLDMKEDDSGDPDIIAGTRTGFNQGLILLYINHEGEFGVPDTTGMSPFGFGEVPNWPDDVVDGLGEVLSLATTKINNDIFPDILYGTRSSSLYTGDLYILPAYGTLSGYGLKINSTDHGEIVSIDVADFNHDNDPDIVVGTRSSAIQGKLVAFFGQGL
ncbi:MAG: VCBS repeat-containing protein [Candidatus Krumholzibacteriota bacterium]|nr:VCBS repeat-containing protein [Candidatus Krumholzibacteriota bacterium]